MNLSAGISNNRNNRKSAWRKLYDDEAGIMTFDFIFATILIGTFSAILFVLSFTYSVVEITQYITFASARTFMAGHWSPEDQRQLGEEKFNSLVNNATFAPFYQNGWFELRDTPGIGDYNTLYPQSNDPRGLGDSANFIGSRVTLIARVLNFEVPIFGATGDNDEVFTANVASYLNREPTAVECLEFNEQRFEALKALDARYNNPNVSGYVQMADNGC